MINVVYKVPRKEKKRNIKVTKRKWKRRNVDWKKFKEEINKLSNITGNNKDEIMENLYKKLRCAGEKSVGYTKGIKIENYRNWWNKDIKEKRKQRKEINI